MLTCKRHGRYCRLHYSAKDCIGNYANESTNREIEDGNPIPTCVMPALSSNTLINRSSYESAVDDVK